MKTNIQARWLFCIVLLSLTAGCTFSTTLNDRLTYGAEKALLDRHTGAQAMNFTMDQTTRKFEYTGFPSGILGSATQRSFPIGATFTAYVEQAQKALFNPVNGAAIPIGVHLAKCQLEYTNSATAFMGGRRAIDWVDITLIVDTLFPWENGKPTQITVHRITDTSVTEMAESTDPYRSVTTALTGLVSDFIDEVVRQVAAHEATIR